jgi:hypothetical protein
VNAAGLIRFYAPEQAEAMLFYGNQYDAKTVDELTCQGYGQPPFYPFDEMSRDEQIEYNVHSMQLEHARRRMESEFLLMLKSEAVFATGYASHSPLDMPATRVVADRWRLLEPNFDDSTAKGSNLEMSGILIFDGSRSAQAPVLTRAFSAAKLREWYGRWVSSNQQTGNLPSRDDDLHAARQALGESIPRSAVRLLRRELAPESWKSFGRRKPSVIFAALRSSYFVAATLRASRFCAVHLARPRSFFKNDDSNRTGF